jgi:hypothetical protein
VEAAFGSNAGCAVGDLWYMVCIFTIPSRIGFSFAIKILIPFSIFSIALVVEQTAVINVV